MTPSELQPDERGAKPVSTQNRKVRKALTGVKRELSKEDLATLGVQKMLIEELERAEEENSELRSLRDRYHQVDKELAVAKQLQSSWNRVDMITTTCIAVGAAALGFLPEAWKSQPGGWITLIFGGILTLIGVIAKGVRL